MSSPLSRIERDNRADRAATETEEGVFLDDRLPTVFTRIVNLLSAVRLAGDLPRAMRQS